MAVSTVRVGDKNLYVVGGRAAREGIPRLAGTSDRHARASVSESRPRIFSPTIWWISPDLCRRADRLAPFIERERQQPVSSDSKFAGRRNPASAEEFHALAVAGPPERSCSA